MLEGVSFYFIFNIIKPFYGINVSLWTQIGFRLNLNSSGNHSLLFPQSGQSESKNIWKSTQRRQHWALAEVRRSQKFSPRRRPIPGAQDGQNLISWRWSLPLPTNPVWWGSMHAISSYRGNRPTNKQTHRQDRLQYTAPQLARSVIISLVKAKLVSVNNCHAVFVMAAACGTMTNYSSHIHTAPVAAGQCLRVWRQQLPPANDSPGRFMWLCPTLSLFIGLCMSQWERYKLQDWKMTYEIAELERRHGIYWKAYMYRSMSFIQSYGFQPFYFVRHLPVLHFASRRRHSLLLIINFSVIGRRRHWVARLSRATARPPQFSPHTLDMCVCVCVCVVRHVGRYLVASWWRGQVTPQPPGRPRVSAVGWGGGGYASDGGKEVYRDDQRRSVKWADRCGHCVGRASGYLVACHPHSSHSRLWCIVSPPVFWSSRVTTGQHEELSTTGHSSANMTDSCMLHVVSSALFSTLSNIDHITSSS